MAHRICHAGLLLALGVSLVPGPARAADPRPKDRAALSDLSLEVQALQVLHHFRMTPAQLETLRKLAPETRAKAGTRQPGKVSEKVRQTLVELRAALLAGDEDRIDRLEEKLVELHESENPDLDDEVDMTAAAKKRAAEVLAGLSPRQVSGYFVHTPYEMPDPLARLLGALDVVGKLKDAEWKEFADDLAEELGWQLGGLDAERSRWVAERVNGFLSTVRSTKPADLRKQRSDMEAAARQFVSRVPPTAVLHNVVEHTLAELLSNPRLSAALDARLSK